MYEAGALERVAIDTGGGRIELVELLVVRAMSLVVDCGCYGHKPRHFTLIFTYSRTRGDGGYLRADGDHVFRRMDVSGPLCLEVDRVYTPIVEKKT